MLRILTWNMHKGIGSLDRRYDLERIATVIEYYDPDVVALQEVDDGVPRSASDDQAGMLGARLGYPHVAFGPNVYLKRGCYGNALLSRHPIVHWHNIDLTLAGKKARGALYAELRVTSAEHRLTLHVVNIHLGLSGMERRWQIRNLLACAELANLDRLGRIVVAGDTNDWSGALVRGRLRRAGFQCVTGVGRRASLTFPSWQPVGALDRVFTHGKIVCDHHHRARLALASEASDHLPVVVDAELLA